MKKYINLINAPTHMDENIVALERRYGRGFEYGSLTVAQRTLLLNPTIEDRENPRQTETIDVKVLDNEGDKTLLELLDTCEFSRKGTPVSADEYARRKIPKYTEILGVKPSRLTTGTYVFELPNAKVEVRFQALKE
jgi:hypothetical protein